MGLSVLTAHMNRSLQLWHVAWRSTCFMKASPSSWQLGDGVWTQTARQTLNAPAAAQTRASFPKSISRLRWSENFIFPLLTWYIHLFWLKLHFPDGLFSGSVSPLYFLFMVLLFATHFYAAGLVQKWWQTCIFMKLIGTANNCFIIRAAESCRPFNAHWGSFKYKTFLLCVKARLTDS